MAKIAASYLLRVHLRPPEDEAEHDKPPTNDELAALVKGAVEATTRADVSVTAERLDE